MKTYTREAIIIVLLIIIMSCIYIIIENGIGLTKILDFKTIVQSVATFGGAALGATLAGKYTLMSIKKQQKIDDERSTQKIDIQTIKFFDTFYRRFMEIFFYFDMYQGFHGGNFDEETIEKKIRIGIKVNDIANITKERIDEIRRSSLSFELNMEFQIQLIKTLDDTEILWYHLRGWDPSNDKNELKKHDSFVEERIKLNRIFADLQDCNERLKKKYYQL